MKIAIGTENPAKIAAVRTVIRRVWPDAELAPMAVNSGVPAMPMSDATCLAGALTRARAAREQAGATIGVGMEGGVQADPAGLLLVGWAAVVDDRGREGFGGTARLPLPAAIAERILAGEELGPVMDDLLGEQKSNHRGGAVGTLTAGLVLRSQAFEMAVAFALAPFVAAEFYYP